MRVRIEIQIKGAPKNVSRVQKGKNKEGEMLFGTPGRFFATQK